MASANETVKRVNPRPPVRKAPQTLEQVMQLEGQKIAIFPSELLPINCPAYYIGTVNRHETRTTTNPVNAVTSHYVHFSLKIDVPLTKVAQQLFLEEYEFDQY